MSERLAKYRNQIIDTDDGRFHSKKEYRRWCDLKILQQIGEIHGLKRQVPYLLQPEFLDGVGNRVAPITYFADYVYRRGPATNENFIQGKDVLVIEDCKGVKTEAFRLKWKMLKYKMRDARVEFLLS